MGLFLIFDVIILLFILKLIIYYLVGSKLVID
jgi:hypothetical protein